MSSTQSQHNGFDSADTVGEQRGHPERFWLSAHFFFDAATLYDREADNLALALLDDLAAPAHSRGWLQKYFFVRYGEDGPHLRLRMFGKTEIVESHVRPMVRDWSQANGFAERLVSPTDGLPFVDPNSKRRLVWKKYAAELDRYGGVYAIPAAESLFFASTVATHAVLGALGRSRSHRLGQAMIALAVLVRSLEPDPTKAIALLRAIVPSPTDDVLTTFQYEAKHVPFVLEAWRRLRTGEPLTPAYDQYRDAVHVVRGELIDEFERGQIDFRSSRPPQCWDECLALLLPSYAHMMNNRLGVTRVEERIVSQTLAAALESAQ